MGGDVLCDMRKEEGQSWGVRVEISSSEEADLEYQFGAFDLIYLSLNVPSLLGCISDGVVRLKWNNVCSMLLSE